MAKITIFCLNRKRNIKVDERIASALIKMKRALPLEQENITYNHRMMVAKPLPVVPHIELPVEEEEENLVTDQNQMVKEQDDELTVDETIVKVQEAEKMETPKRPGRPRKSKEE